MHQTLLVVEATADPFDWEEGGKPQPWAFTLVQPTSERPDQFATRVCRWIDDLRGRGDSLDRLILLCGDCWDPEVLRARLALLIAARVNGRAKRVVLQVDGRTIEALNPSFGDSTRRTTSSSQRQTSSPA